MWEINEILTWSFVIRGRWSTDWEEGQVYAILASRRIRDLAGALLLHFGKQYTPKKEMIQNPHLIVSLGYHGLFSFGDVLYPHFNQPLLNRFWIEK